MSFPARPSFRLPVRGNLVAILALACPVVGCQKRAPQIAPAEAAVIPVSRPVGRTVTEFVEYTGRTDAVQSVSVRARVTGYLTRMPFTEGAEIKAGDLLFEIDPRPYQAQVEQAESQMAVAEAERDLAKLNYDRTRNLAAKASVSQQEVDQAKAAADEAVARVRAAKATVDVNRLNLSFTQVRAPIDGRVSRYYYTLGNLVTQDQTLLTTVVSMDPMYAYFDVEERTFQRLVKAINAVRPPPPSATASATPQTATGGPRVRRPVEAVTADQSPADPRQTPTVRAGLPVYMGLEGESGFPHRGRLTFVNNQVNPSTGTVAVRAVFDNPRPDGGAWSLLPGMFVRIRLPVGSPHPALLVIDRAVGSDQGLKFVYVVDAENKVQYRRVTTGPLEEDGLRVIEDGLTPDDRVVVGGLQQLRPRAEVRVEDVPMPTLAPGDDGATPGRRRPQPPAGGGQQRPAPGQSPPAGGKGP